ncbi:hypothetical protein Xen7305DRAFT_00044030 [Xenococcus sp. PCC 7305]|uniref:hypothetical protein n=1 Tax=Xenococcus sp. PCC 7305 TaxID=102125 RepID=UPI0002AC5C37|nr:hypothetical protein [Xenococcus sp. PCC 7305]ELS04667.1 hypothetical protein Xen7305DRAFT_00044030 [Xenococcus sp. PCC 7305]
MKNIIIGLSLACFALGFSDPAIANEKNNAIGIFNGTATEDELKFPIPDFEDAGQIGINYNRSLKRFSRFRFEFDTSFFQHYGEQEHWEITAALLLRFYLIKDRLSFGVGDGFSYASEIPELERRRHINTSQVLNFVLLELAVDINRFSALAMRWHHRSGVWGLINDVEGGSNSVQFGIRYKF